MEKKKYEKPIVLDLNGNTANGGPLSCVQGGSASGGAETCVGGTGVSSGDCAFGTFPAGDCEGGSAGTSLLRRPLGS